MATWAPFSGMVIFAAAIILVPGYLLALTFRVPSRYQLFFSPALGLGVLGALTLVWGAAGWTWGWVPVGGTTLLLLVLAGISLFRRSRKTSWRSEKDAGVGPQVLLAFLGVIAFAVIQAWVSLPVMASPDTIPHLGDADFHLQGIELVTQTGNVFPVGGLSDLYAPGETTSVYYPTLLHAWGALLLPFTDVVQVVNMMVIAVALVLWPLGIAGLGIALLPSNMFVGMFAALTVAPIAVFPGVVAIGFSIYPLGLSMVALPTGLAALLRWQASPRAWPYAATFLVATVGAIAAQPTTALFLLAAAGIVVGITLMRWFASSVRSGTFFLPLTALLAVLAMALFAVIRFRHDPYLRNLALYPRAQVEANPVLAFFNGTVVAVSQPWWPWIGFLALALAGFALLWKRPYAWTYFLLAVVASVAYIAAAGPDSTLRALTGPWYKDHLRLASVAGPLIAVLAAVPLAILAEKISKPLKAPLKVVLATIFAIATTVAWVWLTPSIVMVQRAHIGNGYNLDEREFTPLKESTATLFGRLDDYFEPGDRVVGAHGNGTAFVVAYSDLKPFIPLRTPQTAEQKYVAENLDRINEDPLVCEILLDHGVKAFLTDTGRQGYQIWGPLAGAPITDTSEGFELVDSEGSVEIWRITACD